MTTEVSGTFQQKQLTDFLASHGGPFYELQSRLRLLHADSLEVRSRAAIFVALAWGGPLVLGLPGSLSLRGGQESYLLDSSSWARFFVAVAAFVLAERQVERGLRFKLQQFLGAPILAPGSMEAAAEAVSKALRERDSRLAEVIILFLALAAGIASYAALKSNQGSSWAVVHSVDGNRLTISGWWSVCVSLPLCYFLLLRGLWRHSVWARLLRKVARLELRLVGTHPDGRGGLGFLAAYPNAYMIFVFGMSSVVAAALARNLIHDSLSISAFSAVMAGWLAVVILLFAYPLSAFSPPLIALKRRAMSQLGARATRYHRSAERKLLGRNVVAADDLETGEDDADPTKTFETTRKLSTVLVSRTEIIPVTAAALLPFSIVGIQWLPHEEVLSVLKKLLVI